MYANILEYCQKHPIKGKLTVQSSMNLTERLRARNKFIMSKEMTRIDFVSSIYRGEIYRTDGDKIFIFYTQREIHTSSNHIWY